MLLTRRSQSLYFLCGFLTLAFYIFHLSSDEPNIDISPKYPYKDSEKPLPKDDGNFQWVFRQEQFPVSITISMPSGRPSNIPTIQFPFVKESDVRAAEIESRRDVVKASFNRAWGGYKSKAWLADELSPVSGTPKQNRFGGWAATLVDSLDTLWITGNIIEFEVAASFLKDIDFTTTDDEVLNTFETTIRYLGGLLAAHDLSNGLYPIFLEKSLELGHLLYAAFDTENRMPLTRWKWQDAKNGMTQNNNHGVLVAEIGSLSLEFTRLSQISGDPKFFDAIQRISDRFEEAQPLTKLPGMWPVSIDPSVTDFGGGTKFSIGAMADSLYEYLPKQYMLLGGRSQQPKKLYETFMDVAKKHFFFRPMVPDEADILISGSINVDNADITLDPQGQHLACFIGGMIAIGSRIFNRTEELILARKLTDGCIWAYNAMPSGIMPELFHATICSNTIECKWDRKAAESVPGFDGFSGIGDKRYILRPEAIESVFILYRITGDEKLRDDAWRMFTSIEKHTKTEFGSAAIDDVTSNNPPQTDSMESFWTAETLKYFYLIFSPPDLVSLDDYVFNTEAHPFKRP